MKRTLVIFFLCLVIDGAGQQRFVRQHGGKFFTGKQQYSFVGANYWYGSLLALQKDSARGVLRLRKELDFLKARGITNLRVMAGAEGAGKIQGNHRVGPPLQIARGVFDTSVLYGLDVLLDEMRKRQMKAVIFVSNNWEWSGGFLQYLNWNGLVSDSMLLAKLEWETLRDQVAKFYTCTPCKADYLDQVDIILGRRNSINQRRYVDDPTIMSWQLANEPRPMRPAANGAYRDWISSVAAHIKSKDRLHLVSIGHEGEIGTQDFALYERIHRDPNIDYLTIHIWPKNWGWMKGETMEQDFKNAVSLTTTYVNKHLKLAEKLDKPLVIEEFGLPRDGMRFDTGTSTRLRDSYYELLLSRLTKSRRSNGNLAGLNFWAFNGIARPLPSRRFWRHGDDYMGDPPMEEQSLYGVFDNDHSTWKVIANYVRLIGNKKIRNKE